MKFMISSLTKCTHALPTLTRQSMLIATVAMMSSTSYAATTVPQTSSTSQTTTSTKKAVIKPVLSKPAPVKAVTHAANYTTGMVVAGNNSEVIGTIASVSDEEGTGKLNIIKIDDYAKAINKAKWTPTVNVNSAMIVKLQALLDWNHTSAGAMDGGWGANSKAALRNFQAMNNLPADGHMNQKTWDLLTKNIPTSQPVLITYTLTQKDVDGPYAPIPTGVEAKSKAKGLYYQHIKEMLAERFHMDIRYLEKLNQNKTFKAGEKIMVFNPGKSLQAPISRLVASKADNTLYAYNGKNLIATYPAVIGSTAIPSPTGSYTVKNQVKNPYYRATVVEGTVSKNYMLPPGPNNPVGVVWIGLDKANYGVQGTPVAKSYGKPATHGTLRLSNWDALEIYDNVNTNTRVEFK